ncbi:endonuclease domain-containing protein [Thermodesulfobacteriota bacterium]
MKTLKKTAKTLRKNSTDAERKLWYSLRARQINGFKFKRQQPLGNYIVDFVCFEKRLIIELDGGQHAVNRKKDIERDNWLKTEEYQVLRFWNNDVPGNHEGVLSVIAKHLKPPSP